MMKRQLAVKEAQNQGCDGDSTLDGELEYLQSSIRETEAALLSAAENIKSQRSEPERIFVVMNVLEALHPELSIEEVTRLAAMDSFVPLDILREIQEEEEALYPQEEEGDVEEGIGGET